MPSAPGLRFSHVSRSFGAVRALRGVTFDVAEGEAHGLIGENGAGKSTLLKILAGIVSPDRGELFWNGERLHITSPRDALERGIGMVYQEMLCFENLTVAGNIFAGREITRYGRLRRAEMRERTRALLDQLHLPVSPDAAAASLSTAYRQLLQVARALAFECQILVLDEPTTSLTDAETDHLFAVLEKLKARGTTLLYVSHRLPEVFRLCDRITVLRDGAHVDTCARRDVTPDHIVRAMVGRDLPPRSVRSTRATDGDDTALAADASAQAALSVDGLGRRPWFTNIFLTVNTGEIVGLFGLVGSGRSELLETIFGIYRREAGRIRVAGREVDVSSPRDAVRAGIALVPEERQRQGLLFNLSVRDNLVLPERTARGGAPRPRRRRTARRPGPGRHLAHQDPRRRRGARCVERRQPAEDRRRQVARDRAARDPARRADQGRRRRREVRDPRNHPARGGARRRLPGRVERSAGSARARRSHCRHAGGTDSGAAAGGGRDRRNGHAARDA